MAIPAPKVIKFPSIGRPPSVFPHIERAAQYVSLRKGKHVYDESLPLPIITLRGTVKLDGANCAIVKTRVGDGKEVKYYQHYQSRQKLLGLKEDFNGFVAHMTEHEASVSKLFGDIFDTFSKLTEVKEEDVETIAIFGEWCGDKIQKNIALSQLPKFFFIFAVKVFYKKHYSGPRPEDQQVWVDMAYLAHIHNNDVRIYNVEQFDAYEVTVDFRTDMTKAKGLRRMAELAVSVQEECPVAKKLGVVRGLVNGEGIVWKPVQVEHPLKLEKFTGPRCWVKTGAKSAVATSEEVRSFVEFVGGW